MEGVYFLHSFQVFQFLIVGFSIWHKAVAQGRQSIVFPLTVKTSCKMVSVYIQYTACTTDGKTNLTMKMTSPMGWTDLMTQLWRFLIALLLSGLRGLRFSYRDHVHAFGWLHLSATSQIIKKNSDLFDFHLETFQSITYPLVYLSSLLPKSSSVFLLWHL